jgi:flagellar motor switch/type III secretory pathway protein FliN
MPRAVMLADSGSSTSRFCAALSTPFYYASTSAVVRSDTGTISTRDATADRHYYEEQAMSDPAGTTRAVSAVQAPAPGEVQLSLQVSLPPVTLSLEQAESMRTGIIVDLGVALARAEVEVRLGPRLIGHGTLVVVGEHAGVRLRLPR